MPFGQQLLSIDRCLRERERVRENETNVRLFVHNGRYTIIGCTPYTVNAQSGATNVFGVTFTEFWKRILHFLFNNLIIKKIHVIWFEFYGLIFIKFSWQSDPL